ncbi:hypothetical protein QBC35DRAFT_477815 [Podospora australis]|uniref:Uncharacterized protein n=1 Tax=Podospora australis TaxID=1536484 RepID=A0AAN6WL31_9PEZI|nr:hypothetical protein QBC35DRAFT_477815 [Podospora australis]
MNYHSYPPPVFGAHLKKKVSAASNGALNTQSPAEPYQTVTIRFFPGGVEDELSSDSLDHAFPLPPVTSTISAPRYIPRRAASTIRPPPQSEAEKTTTSSRQPYGISTAIPSGISSTTTTQFSPQRGAGLGNYRNPLPGASRPPKPSGKSLQRSLVPNASQDESNIFRHGYVGYSLLNRSEAEWKEIAENDPDLPSRTTEELIEHLNRPYMEEPKTSGKIESQKSHKRRQPSLTTEELIARLNAPYHPSSDGDSDSVDEDLPRRSRNVR